MAQKKKSTPTKKRTPAAPKAPKAETPTEAPKEATEAPKAPKKPKLPKWVDWPASKFKVGTEEYAQVVELHNKQSGAMWNARRVPPYKFKMMLTGVQNSLKKS